MITDWRFGHATQSSCIVVVRSDTNGQITAVCNGNSYTGDTIDTAVIDGWGIITIGDEGSCTITDGNGDTQEVITKFMPADGEDVVLCYLSCMSYAHNLVAGHAIKQLNPNATYALGDHPYCEHNGTIGGIASDSGSITTTLANMLLKYRATYRNTGVQAYAQDHAHYRQHDDHEFPGDNWDHSVANANNNDVGAPAIASTQADVDAIFKIFKDASDIWSIGNPPNNDAGVVAEFPKYAGTKITDAATAESNYQPTYFRHTINNNVEVFVCDFVTHKSNDLSADTGTEDNPDKLHLGKTQLPWLKKSLYDSTATFKPLMFTKRVWGDEAGGNKGDAWGTSKLERDSFTNFLLNSTRSAADKATYGTKDVTGVFSCSGDKHIPTVAYDDSLLDVCTGAASVNIGVSTYGVPNEKWRGKGAGLNIFGSVYIKGSEYAEVRIHLNTGSILWSGRVYAGENKVTYPPAFTR